MLIKTSLQPLADRDAFIPPMPFKENYAIISSIDQTMKINMPKITLRTIIMVGFLILGAVVVSIVAMVILDADNIERRAKAGDAESQNILATMHYQGIGASKNYAESLKWHLRAAEQGHTGSQIMLAAIYAQGLVVEPNPREAYIWFSLAEKQNSNAKTKKMQLAASKKLSNQEILEAQDEIERRSKQISKQKYSKQQ